MLLWNALKQSRSWTSWRDMVGHRTWMMPEAALLTFHFRMSAKTTSSPKQSSCMFLITPRFFQIIVLETHDSHFPWNAILENMIKYELSDFHSLWPKVVVDPKRLFQPLQSPAATPQWCRCFERKEPEQVVKRRQSTSSIDKLSHEARGIAPGDLRPSTKSMQNVKDWWCTFLRCFQWPGIVSTCEGAAANVTGTASGCREAGVSMAR